MHGKLKYQQLESVIKSKCNVNLWWIEKSEREKLGYDRNRQTRSQSVSLILNRVRIAAFTLSEFCCNAKEKKKIFWHRAFVVSLHKFSLCAVSQVRFEHESPRFPITEITINRRRNVPIPTNNLLLFLKELKWIKKVLLRAVFSQKHKSKER